MPLTAVVEEDGPALVEVVAREGTGLARGGAWDWAATPGKVLLPFMVFEVLGAGRLL
jgi:hypothetical protein